MPIRQPKLQGKRLSIKIFFRKQTICKTVNNLDNNKKIQKNINSFLISLILETINKIVNSTTPSNVEGKMLNINFILYYMFNFY